MQNASSLGKTKLTRMILEIRNVNEPGYFSHTLSVTRPSLYTFLCLYTIVQKGLFHLTLGIYIF